MKIKSKHIKRFEAFIQNAKDPNAKETEETKDDKKPTPVDEDEESQDNKDETDPIEEMNKYFAEQKKNYPHLWKPTI